MESEMRHFGPEKRSQKTEASMSIDSRYRNRVLIILLASYCVSFLDRQLLAVFSPMIKADLHLSDTQLGMLKGFAFALFYASMGIPVAMLSDRFNRVKVLSFSLAAWSMMTALCGLGTNFTHLLLARIGVGVGEAGGTPAAHSIISDYFPREKRATALGIYSLGVPIGTLIGFLFGGLFAHALGWRSTFVAFGLPGLMLALLVAIGIREPARGATDRRTDSSHEPDGLKKAFFQLWNIKSLKWIVLAGSLNAFCGYSLSMWLIDFYVRVHHMAPLSVAIILSMVLGIGGGLGSFLGGFFADRQARQDPSAHTSLSGWILIAASLPALLGLNASQVGASLGLMTLAVVGIYAPLGPLYAMVQTLAPVRNRTLATALFLLSQSIIGAGLGPFLMGVVSDRLSIAVGSSVALTLALSLIAPVLAIAGLPLLLIKGQFEKDIEAYPR
jgi:predicted MFS family arabinose efflux permease